jgi:hypothetical protein
LISYQPSLGSCKAKFISLDVLVYPEEFLKTVKEKMLPVKMTTAKLYEVDRSEYSNYVFQTKL